MTPERDAAQAEAALDRLRQRLRERGFTWDHIDAVLDEFALELDATAREVEFRFRSMTFMCGIGESTETLHPAGDYLRKRAEVIRSRG